MNNEKKKILLVEDEKTLAFNLKYNLEAEGYEVFLAEDGLKALELFKKSAPFSVIILDVMLPEIDGFEVARKVRNSDDRTGILMLTALAKDRDRITGFECGVDDYITKPFHLEELLLRVKRMAKRSDYLENNAFPSPTQKRIEIDNFVLDVDGLTLKTPSRSLSVTALEADVLVEFLKHPGKVLSRDYLLESVWGVKGNVETRTVDNFIVRLRKYIEDDPTNPKYLISVRGRGYKFVTTS